MQHIPQYFIFHRVRQALPIDYSLKSQHETWYGAHQASIISRPFLEQGLILILVLCRRSPSQPWVPSYQSHLWLHSCCTEHSSLTASTSQTLGRSNIQTTVDAAAPCLWSAKCLQHCHSTATGGVNTWSVAPCTENKA